MKDLFVFLFPEKEYMKDDSIVFPYLNEAISKRYINKGFEFAVVKYKNSEICGITEKPDNIVEADITFEKSSSYHTEDWKYADFEKVTAELKPENYGLIRIGGYHCLDCVKRLAIKPYKKNNQTIVDTDLTDFFKIRCLRQNKQNKQFLEYEKNTDFDFENYSPKKVFDDVVKYFDSMTEFNMLIKSSSYKHPVFGMNDFFEQKRAALLKEPSKNEAEIVK